ncbi:MAG: hypothetical protein EBR82_72540 [Caulobacteraceae bacterium]|nr:hypothetical protein [Caulobacteraceae bacterium]
MNPQPKALVLADALEELDVQFSHTGLCGEAADELRRQHAEIERLTNLCYDYLGDLTAMRAVRQMQEQKVRFKCTVIDDQHPNGVPLEQWGNTAPRQWVGLTRNEAMEIINSMVGHDWRYAVDAIEAKLKDKNI